MEKQNEFTTWALYDSNVQTYRSNMISSQALLLTVEAILLGNETRAGGIAAMLVCVIGLIQLWYVWVQIIRARAIISDYYKFNAFYDLRYRISDDGKYVNTEEKIKSNECEKPLTEKTYVKNEEIRDKANDVISVVADNPSLKSNFRMTRRKLDKWLPRSFTLIWAYFVGVNVYNIISSFGWL